MFVCGGGDGGGGSFDQFTASEKFAPLGPQYSEPWPPQYSQPSYACDPSRVSFCLEPYRPMYEALAVRVFMLYFTNRRSLK